MKSLSMFLAIATLSFAFSFTANAQRGNRQPPNPEQMAERQTSQMVEKLNLDEVQTAKVKEINLTFAKKMHEVREENKDNRDAMKEIVTAVENEKAAEMKTVLTAKQYKTFENMQNEQTGRKGRKGSGKRSKK